MDPTRPDPNAYPDMSKPQETKQLKRVTTGKVVAKKRSASKRLADVFISEDSGDIKQYVIYDILIPAFKDTISEMITRSVDMLFYGKSTRPRRSNGAPSYVSYSDYSKGSSRNRHSERNYARPKPMHQFDDIIFETRQEAEGVLEMMLEVIDKYECVSVSDFYDLAGVTSKSPWDNGYGWFDLGSACVIRERGGGYSIKLPRPQDIK